MSLKQVIALLVALAGIIYMGAASMSLEVPGTAWIGVLAALLCVVGWGSEAVILTWGMRDDAVDNETALQIRESVSALVYAVIVLPIFGALGFTLRSLATPATGLIALAAVAGVASYLLYYISFNKIGASRSMALNISYSAWAVLFALILMGTVPSPTTIICCILILVGTVLAATNDWSDLNFFSKKPKEEELAEVK